jgi:predicted outer membrane protein
MLEKRIRTMKVKNVISGSLIAVLSGTALLAQQPQQTQPQQTQPQQTQPQQIQPATGQQLAPGQTGQRQSSPVVTATHSASATHGAVLSTNDALAACMAVSNKGEIQLAQFAKDKAKHEGVKEFATMMVEEHQQCLEKLKQVSPQTAHMTAAKGEAAHRQSNESAPQNRNESAPQNRNESAVQNRNEPAPQNQGPVTTDASNSNKAHARTANMQLDFVQLHREVAEQCLADAKEKLSQKEGDEFDKCFMGMQLAAHASMQSKLTVFQKHATGELKNMIAEGLEKVKKHIMHAEKLMAELDHQGSSKGDRKTES